VYAIFVDCPELCERMGGMSKKKVAGHTPARWAEDFENIIGALTK